MATDDFPFLDDFMMGEDLPSDDDLSFPSDIFVKDDFVHDTQPFAGLQPLEVTDLHMVHRFPYCDAAKVSKTFQPIPAVFLPCLTHANMTPFLHSVYLRMEATIIGRRLCDFPTLVALHLKAYLDPRHTIAVQREALLLDFREGREKLLHLLKTHEGKLQAILAKPSVRFIFCPTAVILQEDKVPHALLLVLDKRREMYFFFDPHGFHGDYVKRAEKFVVDHLLSPLVESSGIFWGDAGSQTTCPKGLNRVLQGGRPLCASWIIYELAMCMANPDTDLGILHCAMSITGLLRFLYYLYVTVPIQAEVCIDFGDGRWLKGGLPLSQSLPLVSEPVINAWLVRTGGFGPMSFEDLKAGKK